MTKNLAIVYHDLAVMFEAGLPILKSLNTIASGLRPCLKKVFSDLAGSVSKGNTLTESMAKYPNVFAPLDLMLVETAELSGKLPECFSMLSAWYEFRSRIKRLIISGLMLPLVLIHIAAFVGPLPMLFLGQTTFADYIFEAAATLTLLYVPAAITLAILYLTPRTGLLRRFLDALTLRIPLLGRAVRQLAISRYCRAFNMLYKAGVPIAQCAQKAPGVTGNAIIADFFKGGAESVRAGNPVCDGFSRKLPIDFLNLWQIGEETGELDNSIQKLADNSGQTAEFLFTQLGQWLPRLIYWLVCIVLIIQILRGAAAIGMG
ncbi:Type II secretion system protein F [subsurface metagenome]